MIEVRHNRGIDMKKLLLIALANTVKYNRLERNITQEQLCRKDGH